MKMIHMSLVLFAVASLLPVMHAATKNAGVKQPAPVFVRNFQPVAAHYRGVRSRVRPALAEPVFAPLPFTGQKVISPVLPAAPVVDPAVIRMDFEKVKEAIPLASR